MKEFTVCPNCGKEIKDGTFKTVSIVPELTIEFINEFNDTKSEAYCSSCSKDLIWNAKSKYIDIIDGINNYIKKNINCILILSTHTPFSWEYESLGIVTGQSVTGTGLISEFTSDFTDFFGQQSGSFNRKLANGEQLCFDQLRAKTLKLRGNAIIAADIDYGEAGAGKGMLMVCAAGTAINITNKEVLGEKQEIIETLLSKSTEMERLSMYRELVK